MKLTYEVKVISFEEIHELPGSWENDDLRNILERADFDDYDKIDPSELRDYTIMALQEFEADEAAELVLNYLLGDQLNRGQIENLAHEMMDEKLWEEYTNIYLHKKLYDTSVLLKLAFPGKFPETDAVKCVIEVVTKGDIQLDKTLLARLLANGMDNHAVLNRLFDDQINGAQFPEAEGIIWKFDISSHLNKSVITVYSSCYWLHSMDEVDHYISEAISDH